MSANPKSSEKQGPGSTAKSAGVQNASTGIEVVRRGGSYVVGGTDAKKLVSGQTRSVQSSPKKGRLSAQEVSRLVKRMKVAA